MLLLASLVTTSGATLSAEPGRELFQQRREALRALGIPSGTFILDFLTMELFYNVQGRAVVVRSVEDLRVMAESVQFCGVANS